MEISNNERYIDLRELLFEMIRKFWIILVAGILSALLAGLYSKYFITPVYQSTASVYVINRQNEDKTTLSDLQTGTQLTKDFKILIKSRLITEQIIDNLGLSMSESQLSSMITVNTPTDTRILQITVSHPDASMAKELADALIDVSTEKIVKIMELERINVIEYGNMPLGPSSPNVFKNVLIGGIFGVFLSMAALTFLFLFNDTIKTSDDVEKYLGLNVLGVIPLMGNATNKKLLSKNRKKKAKQQIRRK